MISLLQLHNSSELNEIEKLNRTVVQIKFAPLKSLELGITSISIKKLVV
jgi:hypothetical protein